MKEEERKEELEEAWRGRPKSLKDAIQMDILELIPIMGQVSRFDAGLKARTVDEDFKQACAFTWIFPIVPIRTIKYLSEKK